MYSSIYNKQKQMLSSTLDSLEKQPVPLPAIQDAQASAEIHARVKFRYKTT